MEPFKKLWQLLTKEQRRASYTLLILMIIGMILETLGIGLVIPTLALMTDYNTISQYLTESFGINLLENLSQEKLIISGMIVLVCVYTFKALFLGFLVWKQTLFVFGLQENLSKRLFKSYIKQPYTFHLQRNSAQLIRNVTTEVAILATVIQSVLALTTEGLVLLGIMVLLLIVEPIGAIFVISVLGLAGWVFHRLTKTHIYRWGKARQHHDGLRIQHLQQGLGGAKEVKLLGREEGFLSQFNRHNSASAHVGQRQRVLQFLPRLWLELLAVIGLAVLVLTMILQGKPAGSLLPTLGLFAAAAFRLMPSINKVLVSMQSLKYAVPVIDTLYNEFNQFKTSVQLNNNQLLTIRNNLIMNEISFRYPAVDKLALDNISFEIPFGSSIGIIGGSGAGKSTLVDIILGLLTPNSGSINIDGIDIQQNLRSWQDQIGYVPQTIYLTDNSLRQNIAFGISVDDIDEAAISSVIKAVQLESFVNELPDGLNTIVGERGVRLSGGQRQRIGIARALYHDPAVLVLDEATSSLDSETEMGVMDAVNALQHKKTILIVAHRLTTLKNCTQIIELEHGKIKQNGSYSEIIGAVG